MGGYLSQPIREKNSYVGNSENMRCCSVEMQGWRKSMEDRRISEVDIKDGNSFFAVFDGHGGK
jgi:serine/threonine protein phosphatase PrpC